MPIDHRLSRSGWKQKQYIPLQARDRMGNLRGQGTWQFVFMTARTTPHHCMQARSSRPARLRESQRSAAAMQEFHWSGGRRSDDLHAASTPQAFAEENPYSRGVSKRWKKVCGSWRVIGASHKAWSFSIGQWASKGEGLTTWHTSHEVEFSALYFKVHSTLLKEQGLEGRSLITISSSPSSWLTGNEESRVHPRCLLPNSFASQYRGNKYRPRTYMDPQVTELTFYVNNQEVRLQQGCNLSNVCRLSADFKLLNWLFM